MSRYVVDEESVRKLAKGLYQHQNFSTQAVEEKVVVDGYTPSTVRTYFGALRKYLKDGEITSRLNKCFWDTIEELQKSHFGILTPSDSERIRDYSERKRKSSVRVMKDESLISSAPKVELPSDRKIVNISESAKSLCTPQKFERCGIINGDTLKLFDNEYVRQGYLMAYSELSPEMNFELVSVTVKKS